MGLCISYRVSDFVLFALLFPLALGTVLATGMTMPVPAPLTLPAVNTHTRFSPPLGDKLGLKIT